MAEPLCVRPGTRKNPVRPSTRAITILIPHHNRLDLLTESVSSVKQQSCPPTEIIVLDDCSSPEVRQGLNAVREMATVHENTRNLGVSENFNQGARMAKTEWLGFLADDDLFLPHKLEWQNAYLDEHPECDIIVSPMIMRDDKSARTEIWGFTGPRELTMKDALVHTAILFQTALMRRETYLALKGLDRPPLEDQDFGIRAIHAGYKVHAASEPLVIYRWGGADQLSAHWKSMFRAQMGIIHKYSALYRQEFGPLGVLQMYGRQFARYGLRRGRYLGRAMWAIGRLMQFVMGDPFEEWDRPTNPPASPDSARPAISEVAQSNRESR